MPKKIKTRQSIAKRVKVTGSGKILFKKCGQDHFNARESGKTTRNKRRLRTTTPANIKNIKRVLPYV